MFRRTRRPLVAAAATSMLALGVCAGPAAAQGSTQQEGLVNIALTDTNVQVPVAVAAAVCGVQANVIASQTFGGNALCESASRAEADGGRGGGGSTQQEGLINVALTDTNIQAPIGIAADICGVQANVLAAGTFGGNAVCESAARPRAQR